MSDAAAWQQQAKTALQQLTPPGKPISNAQRFRDLLPDIEQRIAAGVPQADIVAALGAAGLQMNIETFRNYLSAARRRLKANDEKCQTTKRPALPAPAAPQPKQQRSDFRQQRDKPLNW